MQYVMQPGYAETSTRRNPVEPQTVIVGNSEIQTVRFDGMTRIAGSEYARFKVVGANRFYFQLPLYCRLAVQVAVANLISIMSMP